MVEIEPRPEASTAELLREAITEARALFKTEVELAKDELRREIAQVKHASVEFAVAGVLGLLGLDMLLVALVLVLPRSALSALLIGIILLLIAAGLGLLGYRSLPKRPLEQTLGRLTTDVQILKERIA